MGRRKIEIKAIKDERNRSVTFLKRKGGLFKKAYELGVLCSVDVAVIIVGQNNKVYQFSSGNMGDILRYYDSVSSRENGAIHEHRGPRDFANGKHSDDDGDGDYDDPPISPSFPSMISPDMNHQTPGGPIGPQMGQTGPAFSHGHSTASSSTSPPVDGGFRSHGRPTPPRPTSRTHDRQSSGSSYQPYPPASSSMGGFQYSGQTMPRVPQMAQPPTLSPPTMPPPASRPTYPPPPPPSSLAPFSSDLQLPPFHSQTDRMGDYGGRSSFRSTLSGGKSKIKAPPATRNSIFTPIDDRRSLLAQHWKSNAPSAKLDLPIGRTSGGNGSIVDDDRTSSALTSSDSMHGGDTSASGGYKLMMSGLTSSPRRTTLTLNKDQMMNGAMVSPGPLTHMSESSYFTQRGGSMSSLPPPPPPMSTMTPKPKLKLKVQIPHEESDSESDTRSARPMSRSLSVTTSNGGQAGQSKEASQTGGSGASNFLPPLSPSVNNLPAPDYHRSRGAVNNVSYRTGGDETPMSVLGGRFLFDKASFDQPETPFRANMLPSPIGLNTPVGFRPLSLSSDSDYARKRRNSDGDSENMAKKIRA